MRPSLSVSLEHGLDRGVQWGRDLYTFVTSAAGHMMRTLQKPRKNRPSKRQVNHRRFLHNMIQRKFADIEAANHRLASALYFKDMPLQKPDSAERSDCPSQESEKCTAEGAGFVKSRDYISAGSHETEMNEKKQAEPGHLWQHHPKLQPVTKNNQEKQKKGHENIPEFTPPSSTTCTDYYHKAAHLTTAHYDEKPSELNSNPLKYAETNANESNFIQFCQDLDTSTSFSPDLSPLFLDSCDLSVQMLTDISSCTLTQRSITDIAESQWADLIDIFSVKDFGSCADVEAYLESICEGKVSTDDAEVEDLLFETGEDRYDYGYSCHGDPGEITKYLQSSPQRMVMNPNEGDVETQLNNFNLPHSTSMFQTELQTSISCCYNISETQTYQDQQQSTCILGNHEHNQSFTLFEGVAQSFSAPLHNLERRPVPTPPQDEDWLFIDILRDNTMED